MAKTSVELKFDQRKLVRIYFAKREKFLNLVQRNFRIACEQFLRIIISTFYSGRKAEDLGLYRQSGDLAKKWWKEVTISQGDVIAKIGSGVDYGRYHEKDYEPKGGQRKVPARTDVTGYFYSPEVGKKLFIDAIKKAMEQA